MQKYIFPAIIVITLICVMTALAIIHWNHAELSLMQDWDKQISNKRCELAKLSEKITDLAQQEAVFSQKKKIAEKGC